MTSLSFFPVSHELQRAIADTKWCNEGPVPQSFLFCSLQCEWHLHEEKEVGQACCRDSYVWTCFLFLFLCSSPFVATIVSILDYCLLTHIR